MWPFRESSQTRSKGNEEDALSESDLLLEIVKDRRCLSVKVNVVKIVFDSTIHSIKLFGNVGEGWTTVCLFLRQNSHLLNLPLSLHI